MNVNIDPDTSPDTYIEHRELVRIADAGSTEPAAPTRIGSARAPERWSRRTWTSGWAEVFLR